MHLKKFKKGCAACLAAAMIFSMAVPVQAEAAWKRNNTGWWWQEDNGSYPAVTWRAINGKQYYFDQRGYMKTGWLLDGGCWYYLGNANDGAMKTGWQRVNGKWYFLNPDGKMATGWKNVNGKRYFLEKSGAMHYGWLKDGGYWYYMGGSGDGAMKTGWQQVNGKYYYMYSDGKMAANTWVEKYYVNGSGVWTKTKQPAKWIKSGGRWWYRHEDGGYTKNGFERINGKDYYFDNSGWMVTGWKKINNKWYYFDKSGAMKTNGWVGNYYVGSDGIMETNTWAGDYYVGNDGKWIPGMKKPAGGQNGNGSTGGSGGGNSQPPAHVHTWEAKTKTIHHEEEGYYQYSLEDGYVTPPWRYAKYICKECSMEMSSYNEHASLGHKGVKNGFVNKADGREYSGSVYRSWGSDHHMESVGHYDENGSYQTDGYKCTSCNKVYDMTTEAGRNELIADHADYTSTYGWIVREENFVPAVSHQANYVCNTCLKENADAYGDFYRDEAALGEISSKYNAALNSGDKELAARYSEEYNALFNTMCGGWHGPGQVDTNGDSVLKVMVLKKYYIMTRGAYDESSTYSKCTGCGAIQ